MLAGVQGTSARGTGRHHVQAVVHAAGPAVTARIEPWAAVEALTPTSCAFRTETGSLDGSLVALG